VIDAIAAPRSSLSARRADPGSRIDPAARDEEHREQQRRRRAQVKRTGLPAECGARDQSRGRPATNSRPRGKAAGDDRDEEGPAWARPIRSMSAIHARHNAAPSEGAEKAVTMIEPS